MNKLFSSVVLVLVLVSEVQAQFGTSSPYSRYGLGELEQNIFPVFNGLGSASLALNNPKIVNPNNPATYTYFSPNSFLLSTGGWHQTTKTRNIYLEDIENNNGFSYLVLGFPLTKKTGASFGIIPFSSTGYFLSTRDAVYDADVNYYGDGGLSKVYFGAATSNDLGLSVGINVSYLFGGLNRRKQLIFDDETFLNSRSNSKINLRGYYYELGILYKEIINKDDEFLVGLAANNNPSLRAKKTELVESFSFSGIFEIPKDTFVNSTQWGDIALPQYFRAGISFNKQKRWLFVAEYSMEDWANYSMFNESDDLVNSFKICGGIQYTPKYNSITKYYKRMDFRIGGSFVNTPMQFGVDQLKEVSISFGVGIPIKKSRTKYDFSCVLGKRGTTDNSLIEEQFVRFGLSVSYDGIWFVKRKYD